jgi:hypothetical protein
MGEELAVPLEDAAQLVGFCRKWRSYSSPFWGEAGLRSKAGEGNLSNAYS